VRAGALAVGVASGGRGADDDNQTH
jgi:hypothetical protein